jgi:subtilisin family serine protease
MKILLTMLVSALLLNGSGVQKNAVVHGVVAKDGTNTAFIGFKKDVSHQEQLDAIASFGDAIEAVHYYENIPGLTLVTLSQNSLDNLLSTSRSIGSNSAVSFFEIDKRFTAVYSEVIPNDAGFSQCWGHRNTGASGGVVNFDMNSTDAWSITQGSEGVKILVLETGVQQDHPDINQLPGRDFTTGAVNGVLGGGPSNSCDNHGTSVAGCITGAINNSIGTVGVAPKCKVISAKVGVSITPCNGSWQGQTSWTVNAINWAIGNGVRVTNNSNDYGTVSAAMSNAYGAAKAAGVVNFASSGNSGNTAIGFPASAAGVNAVGASSRSGQKASFSSYGAKLAFTAPGQSVYTTDRTGVNGYGSGDYTTIDGTSFSSPYAAGVAALIISANPSLTAVEVESIMKSTCKDMGAAGFDTLTGWGALDADGAVREAVRKACPADFDGDGSVSGNDLGILLSSWGASSLDITGDGVVNGGDMGVLLSAWGPCP